MTETDRIDYIFIGQFTNMFIIFLSPCPMTNHRIGPIRCRIGAMCDRNGPNWLYILRTIIALNILMNVADKNSEEQSQAALLTERNNKSN